MKFAQHGQVLIDLGRQRHEEQPFSPWEKVAAQPTDEGPSGAIDDSRPHSRPMPALRQLGSSISPIGKPLNSTHQFHNG
jgi:hypothetical protein